MECNWSNIMQWEKNTREERQFCADLYSLIRSDHERFFNFLNSNKQIGENIPNFDSTKFVDVGFEVAFYRDIKYKTSVLIGNDKASNHRKFDIAIFLKAQLIIIEAKAQQGFKTDDVNQYKKDIKLLSKHLENIDFYFISICSSKYWDSPRRKRDIDSVINKNLTWNDLDKEYPRMNFKRANEIYRR